MKSFGRMFGSFALAAIMSCAPIVAMAATPIQGSIVGGGYTTFKADKGTQRAVGVFVGDTNDWNASVSLTDGTSTALKAAAGVGFKRCITMLQWSGISTTTEVSLALLDVASAKFTTNVLATGVANSVVFPNPICSAAANTALNVQLSGSPTGAVRVNAVGYTTQ